MGFQISGGGISASAWGSWSSDTTLGLPLRIGPASSPGNTLIRNFIAHVNPPPPNQCIFVRGYRAVPLGIRADFVPHIIRGAAEPRDDARDFDQENEGQDAIAAGVAAYSDAIVSVIAN